MTPTTLPVIFRTFPDGDVIALFPTEPADLRGYRCMSYMHIGQHSAADPGIVARTRPATDAEIAPLWRELLSIGYRGLVQRQRISAPMTRIRLSSARAARL